MFVVRVLWQCTEVTQTVKQQQKQRRKLLQNA